MRNQVVTASEGKVFRRISDGMLFGNEIYLGMAYPRDGTPYKELPEHFEEIDDPADAETVLLDEETPLVTEEVAETEAAETEAVGTEAEVDVESVKKVVTMADYRELEKKVELLIKIIGGTE